MTADEVYLACRQKGIGVSIATVYRNLGILVEEHVLRRVPVAGKPDCFDITVREHSHKVCTVCGKVSDADVGDLKDELMSRLGMPIDDYELCIRYVCPQCCS